MPKIHEVKEQITRREFVQLYKIEKPPYVNFHELNPKELDKADKKIVTDSQIKVSPVKGVFNGLEDTFENRYLI